MNDEAGLTDVLTVTETTESRQFWLEQESVKNLESQLAAAEVLIVPIREFRPGVNFVFYQDTPALFDYLKMGLDGQAVVEICINDDEYLEIALHSNAYRLSRIVVSYAIAPVIFGLLTNYIYDELKAKPKDSIELSMTIEDEKCKAFDFSFKGEAKDLNLVADKVGQMARDCMQRKQGVPASSKKKDAKMRGEVWETAERFIDALKNPNSELSCLAEPDLDEKLSALKAESINRGNEKEANLVWCAQSIAEVQRHFIGAFSKLKDGKFYDAWCEFERCEISLSSLLEHFSTDEPDSHGLLYIQRMVERWQSLYPYKIFLSPELLKKIIVCSICGGRIAPRANCGHKKGDLYNGEICHHIIESAELISISLVEQPVQRYSVAFLSNEDGTQRDHYDYGNVKFVVDRVASPFHEWHPERTRRIVTAAELAHVSIDHPCPCLSGKLFGECCSNMPEVDIPHLQISFFVPPPQELPTLELLV